MPDAETRKMIDGVRIPQVRLYRRDVADVGFDQRHTSRLALSQIFALSVDQVVDNDDMLPPKGELVYQFRTDESGATGHDTRGSIHSTNPPDIE
jgi:hypothetical protein